VSSGVWLVIILVLQATGATLCWLDKKYGDLLCLLRRNKQTTDDTTQNTLSESVVGTKRLVVLWRSSGTTTLRNTKGYTKTHSTFSESNGGTTDER